MCPVFPVLRCCIFLTCRQTWLSIKLLSQIEIYIYFFQLPIKARRLDHLNIGDITCQCTYLVICRHVFLTYTVLLCAIVNRNCNMDVSLYYKIFPLLMKNLLFNWHTQDNREWWYSVVQDSVMLYTGSFEVRINLPFYNDGVGSDTHLVFIQWLLRAQEWLRWEHS